MKKNYSTKHRIALALGGMLCLVALVFATHGIVRADTASTTMPWSWNGSSWIWDNASSTPCAMTSDSSATACPWVQNNNQWVWNGTANPWDMSSSTSSWAWNGWLWNGTSWTWQGNGGTTNTNGDIQALQNRVTTLEQQVATLQAQVLALQTAWNNWNMGSTTNPGNGCTGTTTNPGNGSTTPPTSSAMITPSNITINNGGSVDFNGRGFGNEETVNITNGSTVMTTAHADGGGNFSTGSLQVSGTGTQTFTFTGARTGIMGSATVTVQ